MILLFFKCLVKPEERALYPINKISRNLRKKNSHFLNFINNHKSINDPHRLFGHKTNKNENKKCNIIIDKTFVAERKFMPNINIKKSNSISHLLKLGVLFKDFHRNSTNAGPQSIPAKGYL